MAKIIKPPLRKVKILIVLLIVTQLLFPSCDLSKETIDHATKFEDYSEFSDVVKIGNYQIQCFEEEYEKESVNAKSICSYLFVDLRTKERKVFFKTEGNNRGCQKLNDKEFIICFESFNSSYDYYVPVYQKFSIDELYSPEQYGIKGEVIYVGHIKSNMYYLEDDDDYFKLVKHYDNGEVKTIINMASNFQIVGNSIYYLKNDIIYQSDKDGNNETEVLNTNCIENISDNEECEFYLKGNAILVLFINEDKSIIYNMASREQELINVYFSLYNGIVENENYYFGYGTTGKQYGLYRIDKESLDIKRLCDIYDETFHNRFSIIGDFLYFSTPLAFAESGTRICENGLFKLNIETEEITKLQMP